MHSRPILLVGASCRAAAQSLQRLGLSSIAWDLFADRDTMTVCDARQIESFALNSISQMMQFDKSFVLPCGGFENAEEAWAELSNKHCLLGPTPGQLKLLRDPFWLQAFCGSDQNSISFPRTHKASDLPVVDNGWLVKNSKSAGGNSVRFVQVQGATSDGDYVQEFMHGIEFGVSVYCNHGHSQTLAATIPSGPERDRTGRQQFGYQGSLGPIELPETHRTRIRKFFDHLSCSISFQGILQADLILRDNDIYLLEINPRWTAGMEVAELLAPGCLLSYFSSQDANRPLAKLASPHSTNSDGCVYKQIVYAPSSLVVSPQLSDQWMSKTSWQDVDQEFCQLEDPQATLTGVQFRLADVPVQGSIIQANSPVCTMLVRGCLIGGCSMELANRRELLAFERIAEKLNPIRTLN